MAWYFGLAAECGASQETAQTFSRHFEGFILKLSDGLETSCAAGEEKDSEGNWWGVVTPHGVNLGSPLGSNPKLCDAKHTTEIGFLLYEHLKSAPSFRYAAVGWEVVEFRNFSELESSDLEILDGLVLSKEMWERLGGSSSLESFGPDYYWRPYRGETRNY